MEKSKEKKTEKSERSGGHEKPLSLYPMTFEEAIKKLAKKPPVKNKEKEKGAILKIKKSKAQVQGR